MIDKQRITVIKLGAEELRFDNNAFTNKTIRQMRVDIEKCVDQFRKDEDKRLSDFQAMLEKLSEDCKKKDKETDKAHEARVAKLTEEFNEKTKEMSPEDSYWLHDLAFRVLKVIASLPTVNQAQKVTQANFDDAPWEPMRDAIAYLLFNHGMESIGSSFLPPKLPEEN